MLVKGTGHAAAAASLLTFGTPLTPAFSFAAGSIVFDSAAYGAGALSQIAYALWRRADGNADPDQSHVLAIGHYLGDGAASRAVSVSPGPGLRPLFAIVASQGGVAAEMRDPFHTTTTSSSVTGTSHASGYIQAGAIDGFSVGASLNLSGVTYSWIVIWGGTAEGNGGWSEPGVYEPVPPETPPTWPPGPGGPTPPGPETPPGPPGPPAPLPEEPDFDPDDPLPGTTLFCVDFTSRLINLALLRIGVSKQTTNLIGTEATEEAAVARLHVKYDVQTTLRDFPWPFATRYATLVLVSGTPAAPVNADWTYAYRQPTDCVFERRIVSGRGAAVNPTPPPFALARDTGGGLIFCNEANAVLEYTSRVQCPTYEGDELFKDALAWRFAMSLAAPLTRMREKEDYARQMYEAAIRRAYEVLRPGNPGGRATADPLAPDAAVAATAANVAVVNRALVRIGAQTIAALTDQGREAIAAALIFEDELRATLRDHPWAFATRYAELRDTTILAWVLTTAYSLDDEVSSGGFNWRCILAHTATALNAPPNATYWLKIMDLALVEGTVADPVNPDWTFSYRLPDDYLFARRLVRPGSGRRFDPAPDLFRTATDETGDLLFCDIEDPALEYTARLNGAVLRADALFRDAVAWRLAASLAPSLATKEPEAVEQLGRGPDATAPAQQDPRVKYASRSARERMTQYAWAMYRGVLVQAQVVDAREQQQSRGDDDADWILARG
jgi:hypothetical protein